MLVADDPRRSADRILARLVQIHRARGGAILRPLEGQVEVWLSAGLSLSGLAELPVRWADHFAELVLGRTVVVPGFAMVPAMLGAEMVAAVSKLCRVSDLVAIAAKTRVVTGLRTTLGLPGRLATRLQPNHPTDDAAGITASLVDGLLHGAGDACLLYTSPSPRDS